MTNTNWQLLGQVISMSNNRTTQYERTV